MTENMTEAETKFPWKPGSPEELFDLELCIDEGAFGQVWRGKEKSSKTEVAIKIVPNQAEILDELAAEVGYLDMLSSEYIIKYHGSWLNQGSEIWIAMEIAELGSIAGVAVYCLKKFNEAEIAALFARTMLGLEYIHSKKLIHQDIKAKNILLNLKGEIKLADFGVMTPVTDNINYTVGGSPHWMSPEMLLAQTIDTNHDVWSLGITVIEVAEGEPPLAETAVMDVISLIPENPPPKFKTPYKWSDNLKDFLSQCLIKDPKKRPTSVELLDHPFLMTEVERAKQNKNEVLRKVAVESFDTIESYRWEEEKSGYAHLPVDGEAVESDEEYSDSEDSSDEDEILIGNARQVKVAKKKRSKSRKTFKDGKSLVRVKTMKTLKRKQAKESQAVKFRFDIGDFEKQLAAARKQKEDLVNDEEKDAERKKMELAQQLIARMQRKKGGPLLKKG